MAPGYQEASKLGGRDLVAMTCARRGISRPELAALMDVTPQAVRHWEVKDRVAEKRRRQLERLLVKSPPPINVRAFRKRQGMTIVQLAKRLRVSKSSLSRWEHGERMDAKSQQRFRRLQDKLEGSPDGDGAVRSRLLEVRESMGMTQPELARYLGVAPNTVSRWENRVNPTPVEIYKAIAQLSPGDQVDRPTAEWVKVTRQQRGLTCRDLAAKLDVQPARISEWERGKTEIPRRLYSDVRRALEPKAAYRARDEDVVRLLRAHPEGMSRREILDRYPPHDEGAVKSALDRRIAAGELFRIKRSVVLADGRRGFGWSYFSSEARSDEHVDQSVVKWLTGAELKRRLDAGGWTQAAFAEAVGVNPEAIYSWCARRRGSRIIPAAWHAEVVRVLVQEQAPALYESPRRSAMAMPDLRARRVAAGVTQRELAMRTGLGETTLRTYERLGEVSEDAVAKILHALAQGPPADRGDMHGGRGGVPSSTGNRVGRKQPQTPESRKRLTRARLEREIAAGLNPVTPEELRDARGAMTHREFAAQLGVPWTRSRDWEKALSPVPTAMWSRVRQLGACQLTLAAAA